MSLHENIWHQGNELVKIGSANGLLSGWHQAITWTNADLMWISLLIFIHEIENGGYFVHVTSHQGKHGP